MKNRGGGIFFYILGKNISDEKKFRSEKNRGRGKLKGVRKLALTPLILFVYQPTVPSDQKSVDAKVSSKLLKNTKNLSAVESSNFEESQVSHSFL